MVNSRILLSALTAGILTSCAFGDEGIHYHVFIKSQWAECGDDTGIACNPNNENAGIYAKTDNANGANVTLDSDHGGYVYGGYAEEGDATGNKVFVKDGSQFSDIVGGYVVKNGSANENEVKVESSVSQTIQIQNIYGGRTSQNADYNAKDANNNKVTIENGTITGSVTGGDAPNGSANNNTIIIKNGIINGYVKGGYSGKSSANENNVTITGGTITGNLTGGQGSGEANKNIIEISNATISGNQIIVGQSTGGNANENTLIINNGANITSTNGIFVGFSTKGKAHNNVLVFKGGTISPTTAIYGGYSKNDSVGNQLIVANTGLSVKSVNNFQEYFFALPKDIQNGDTMLTLSDKLAFNTDDKINVAAQGALSLKKRR